MLPVGRIPRNFLARLIWNHHDSRQIQSFRSSPLKRQTSRQNNPNTRDFKPKTVAGPVTAHYQSAAPRISISLDELFESESTDDGFDAKAASRAFYKESEKYRSHVTTDTPSRLDKQTSLKALNFLGNVSLMKDNLTVTEVVEGFVLLGHLQKDQLLALVKDKKFEIACEYVTEYCGQFDTQQLVDMLTALTNFELSPKHPLFPALEGECVKRMNTWDTDTQLLVSDAWRLIGRSVPRYNNVLLERMEGIWRDLSKHQLVQLLYIIGEHRTSSPSLMNKLENLMLRYLDDFTVREIAAVCLGFFKTKFSISSSTVLQKFGDIVSQNLHQVDQFSLVCILKVYRHSHFQHRKLFEGIATMVTPKVSKMSGVASMHIGLTYASLHLMNGPLLDVIAQNAVAKIHSCRSKDIAKYLWTFCSLDYEPANSGVFFSTILERMKRQLNEFDDHPEHLISSLLSLAYIDRYQYDLIDHALHPAFQQTIAEKCTLEVSRELFVLDSSVGIECPDYHGNRLPKGFIKQLPRDIFGNVQYEMKHRQEIKEVVALLPKVLGSDKYYRCHFILPHFKSLDIEIQLDKFGNPIPKRSVNTTGSGESSKGKRPALVLPGVALQLSSDLLNELTGQSSRQTKGQRSEIPPSDNSNEEAAVKLAVLVSGRNHHRYNSQELLGLQVMKRRQLRSLGYAIVEIPHYEWFDVKRKGLGECEKWLKNKIMERR